jgi:hypothetical protein
MVWIARYNANADVYNSPKVVRDWYNAGFVPVTWDQFILSAFLKFI